MTEVIMSIPKVYIGLAIPVIIVITWLLDNALTVCRFKSKKTEKKIKEYLSNVQVNEDAESKIIEIMKGDKISLENKDIDIRFYEIPKGKRYRKKYKGNPDGAVVKVYIRVDNYIVYNIVMRYDTRKVFNILDDFCIKQKRARNIRKERKDRQVKNIKMVLIKSVVMAVIVIEYVYMAVNGVQYTGFILSSINL